MCNQYKNTIKWKVERFPSVTCCLHRIFFSIRLDVRLTLPFIILHNILIHKNDFSDLYMKNQRISTFDNTF